MSWQLGGCFRRKGERQASSWPPSPGCRCGACLWHPGVAELSSTRKNSAGSLERTSEWYDVVKGTTVTGVHRPPRGQGKDFLQGQAHAVSSSEECGGGCQKVFQPLSSNFSRGRKPRAGRTSQRVKLEASFGPLSKAKRFEAGTTRCPGLWGQRSPSALPCRDVISTRAVERLPRASPCRPPCPSHR